MEPQSKRLGSGSPAAQRVVLGGWWLHRGAAKRTRLEVVADSGGDEPVEVLYDGRPVALIDRPSVNTGRQTKTRPIGGVGQLRVHLDSPDDGATVKCHVFIDGHHLSPTEADVDLANLEPKGQQRAWEVFSIINAAAITALLMWDAFFGLLDDLGLRDRGPLAIGVFVVALVLFNVIAWWIQRPVNAWIDGHQWSKARRVATKIAYLIAQLAAFACFLLLAGLVLRSF